MDKSPMASHSLRKVVLGTPCCSLVCVVLIMTVNHSLACCFVDNVDVILSGIANSIDIDAIGSDGRNALHWACTLNRTSICHVLLKKGASLSKKDVGLHHLVMY